MGFFRIPVQVILLQQVHLQTWAIPTLNQAKSAHALQLIQSLQTPVSQQEAYDADASQRRQLTDAVERAEYSLHASEEAQEGSDDAPAADSLSEGVNIHGIQNPGVSVSSHQVRMTLPTTLMLDGRGLHQEGINVIRAKVHMHEARSIGARLLENAWLKQANTELIHDDARLRGVDAALRQQAVALRAESRQLAQQLAVSKLAAARASSSVAGQLTAGKGAPPMKIAVFGSCVILFAMIVFHCYHFMSPADDGDEAEDNDEEMLTNMTDDRARSSGIGVCACCRCFCSTHVMFYSLMLGLITAFFSYLAWKTGVLKTLLSQVGVYIYVVGVVAAFVTLLICEVWRLVSRFVRYTIRQFQAAKRLAKKQANRVKDTVMDFMDDGALNTSYRGGSASTDPGNAAKKSGGWNKSFVGANSKPAANTEKKPQGWTNRDALWQHIRKPG